jgi:uncharacterized protein involved in outer membrane biogenesis
MYMNRWVKWLLGGLVVLVLLLGAVAVALQRWVNTDDFRLRVSQQASAALGVPVLLDRITVDVWPLPAVALDKIQIKSQPPLTLERVEARPVWAGLLLGRLEIATLVVRNAVIPEQAVAAIAGALQKKQSPGAAKTPPGATLALLPRRTVLEDLTWVSAKGERTTVDAQALLDDDGLPGTARIEVRKGQFAGARAMLEREPEQWVLRAQIGGGNVNGKIHFQSGTKGASLLQGQFDTAGVEVSALTAPSRTLTGQVDAHTTVRAEFRDPAQLTDVLQSQTRFTVRNAVVRGIDLAQAVKTVGLSRGGETRLDTLSGNVGTQGKTVHLTNLVASSGVLAASGNVTLAANRSLSGRVSVDLGSAIGVPLSVGGTLDDPSVTLAVLSGATGAGAKLTDKLGEGLRGLFGK